jgi:hypothetical protein
LPRQIDHHPPQVPSRTLLSLHTYDLGKNFCAEVAFAVFPIITHLLRGYRQRNRDFVELVEAARLLTAVPDKVDHERYWEWGPELEGVTAAKLVRHSNTLARMMAAWRSAGH